jgi:pimeloyl-ACP methyl ester carboxylesterase
MRDAAMTLGDGRTLAYTDLGDMDGSVVMYFHGAPTSRLDLVDYEECFVDRGVRVVSPDRPGFGGSSPQPNRSMRDWPADAAALANALRVDRFVVVGLSAGGPYAVACAALLADRVVGLGIANGVTDMGWSPAWDGYDAVDASIMRLGDEEAARMWMEERYGADGSRFFEFTTLAPADAALLEDQARAQTLLATIVESFRQGVGGLAADLTIQGRPWPFDPSAVLAPTIVLHGDADPYLPVAHGRHTAEVIPPARFVLLRGQGHVSLIREIPQLCTDLLALAKEAAP